MSHECNILARPRADAECTLPTPPAGPAPVPRSLTGAVRALAAALRAPGSQTRLLAGTVAGSAGLRLVGMALSFLVGIQLARYLGVEQYGIYGYAMAVATVASTVALFGLHMLAVRETAIAVERKDWAGLAGFLRWAWLRVVVLALTLAVAAGIWLFVEGPASAMPLPFWVALFVPCTAILALAGSMLRGLGAIVGGQSLDTLLAPGAQCLLLFGAMLAMGALTAAAAFGLSVIASALAAGVGIVWLWRRIPAQARTAAPRIDSADCRRATRPMAATSIIGVLDSQLPMLVLGGFVIASDLGTFRVALASMLFVSFPYTLIGFISLPIASRLAASGDLRRLQRLASVMTVTTLLPTVAILALLWLFGVPLITFIFGADYAGAGPVLVVLGTAGVLNSFFGVTPAILFATGHERQVTIAFAAGLVTLAALLVVLANVAGILGAAAAIVGGVLVRETLLWRFCLRDAGVDPAPWAVPAALGRP